MKKYIGTILVLLIALFIQVFPVLAWDDCPFGLVNDPYPGSCPRYIDTNNDGICDHSQSAPVVPSDSPVAPVPEGTGGEIQREEIPLALPEETTSSTSQRGDQDVQGYAQSLEKLSLLSLKELKALTIQELSDTYYLPSEPLISALALKGVSANEGTSLNAILKEGGFSRSEFLTFLGEVYASPEANSQGDANSQGSEASSNLDNTGIVSRTDTLSTGTSSTPTLLAVGGSQRGKSSPLWWTRGEAFALFSTLFLVLLLKGLTLYQKRFPKKSLSWFTLKNYHFALNLILLLSFALSFISGLMDYLSLTFNLFSAWGKTIVALHYDSSFVMLLVGAVHAFWHIPYYRGCLRQTGKLWKKNRETFWKWALNIVLTASFIVSILSGLLNYLALLFRWTGVAFPSLEVHIYSSLVMMAVSVLHTLWHLEYYRKNLSLSPSKRKKTASETEICPIS